MPLFKQKAALLHHMASEARMLMLGMDEDTSFEVFLQNSHRQFQGLDKSSAARIESPVHSSQDQVISSCAMVLL